MQPHLYITLSQVLYHQIAPRAFRLQSGQGSELASQISAAEFVIETFENPRMLLNSNASRSRKYTGLQYTDRSRLCGIKTLDYYSERNIVAAVPSGERNFHIFYYLMAGALPEEGQRSHLQEKVHYRYLRQWKSGPQGSIGFFVLILN